MESQFRLFKDNFAQVGTDTGCALIKDGPADYLFYLTGRRNCQYVHGRITVVIINFYLNIFKLIIYS